jgi:glycosyltransferase involved in cell wall biosynthesis
VKEKGLHRLLEAWVHVHRAHPTATVVLVGDGPLRGELEALGRRLEISESVRFVGHQQDVQRFYAMADVFVLSSVSEGVSNSLLEAMAAGVPVVASDVGGNKDIIEHKHSGFLVDWDDAAAASDVLSTLVADAALREAMGRAARERVASFAMTSVAERYHRLYREIVAR